MTLRQPDSLRFQSALSLDQQRRAERVLAVARAFVAVAAVVVISRDYQSTTPWVALAYVLLAGYSALSLFAVLLLQDRPHRWTVPPMTVHLVDVSVATAVTLCTGGLGGAFYVLFMFTVLAAAYRWGFAETLVTASVAVSVLALDAFVPAFGGDLRPDRLVVHSTYVLLAGLVMGYLAQTEKGFRSENAALAMMMGRADVRAGLRRTMAAVFESTLDMFDAQRVLLVLFDKRAGHLFMWEASRSLDGSLQGLRSLRLESGTLPIYTFAPDAAAWHVVRRRLADAPRFDVVALDRSGARLKAGPWTFTTEFLAAVGSFDRLMAVDVDLGDEWTGRVFLTDPRASGDRAGLLGLGQRLVGQIAPAVHNVYILHRLRSAASANERARIARELHDGVIQSVIGVQIQIAALTRRLTRESPTAASELSRLDATLRQEVVSLRELMQQMKPLDLDPDQLVDALADFVQRFQRETGIAARFVTQLDRVALAPNACREVARILNEALVNVRRHSGAHNVFVRLATVNGDCRLSIDDDGCGFPFAGRLSQADLEASRKGPLVIKERVRLLGGQLTIESDPGHGSRLEIAVPLSHGIQ
jgi:signal transduction histidine kinase